MIWVVVPALDEAENLEILLPRILSVLDTLVVPGRVLVVDDGSTDDTRAVVEKLAQEDARVLVESHRRNLGKAAALHLGFGVALDHGAEVIAMMDADGQDDPSELPRLLHELDTVDLVTGARLERNDRFVKRSTSRVYNRATGLLSRTPGRDFNSGYKVMRAEVARAVRPMLYGEMHRYLTVIAHQSGFRVGELAVQHHPRMSGASKYGLARFWRGFFDLLTVRFLLSYENRPSHLFGGAGLVCFGLGTATLLYLTGVKLVAGQPIGDRPLLIAGVLLTLVGLQLTVFGLLAELVVHARNKGTQARST